MQMSRSMLVRLFVFDRVQGIWQRVGIVRAWIERSKTRGRLTSSYKHSWPDFSPRKSISQAEPSLESSQVSAFRQCLTRGGGPPPPSIESRQRAYCCDLRIQFTNWVGHYSARFLLLPRPQISTYCGRLERWNVKQGEISSEPCDI